MTLSLRGLTKTSTTSIASLLPQRSGPLKGYDAGFTPLSQEVAFTQQDDHNRQIIGILLAYLFFREHLSKRHGLQKMLTVALLAGIFFYKALFHAIDNHQASPISKREAQQWPVLVLINVETIPLVAMYCRD